MVKPAMCTNVFIDFYPSAESYNVSFVPVLGLFSSNQFKSLLVGVRVTGTISSFGRHGDLH